MAQVPCTDIELTYLDLVSMLHNDVEKDNIPDDVKAKCLDAIDCLGLVLESYSA